MKLMKHSKHIIASLVGLFLFCTLLLCPIFVQAEDEIGSEYIKSIKVQIYNLNDKIIYDKTFVFDEDDLNASSDTLVLLGADASDLIFDDQQIDHIHIKVNVQSEYSSITTYRGLVRIDDDLNSKVLYYTDKYHYDWTLEYTYSEYTEIRRSDQFTIYVADKDGERISEYITLIREGTEPIATATPTASPESSDASATPESTATASPAFDMEAGWGEGEFPTDGMQDANTNSSGFSSISIILFSAVVLAFVVALIIFFAKRAKKRKTENDPEE